MGALQKHLFEHLDSQGRQLAMIVGSAKPLRFNGPDYDPKVDRQRLTGQLLRIFTLMKDGKWRTYREIAEVTGDPENSISAQLRHLRKPRFGAHHLEHRPRAGRRGLNEYRLIVNWEELSA